MTIENIHVSSLLICPECQQVLPLARESRVCPFCKSPRDLTSRPVDTKNPLIWQLSFPSRVNVIQCDENGRAFVGFERAENSPGGVRSINIRTGEVTNEYLKPFSSVRGCAISKNELGGNRLVVSLTPLRGSEDKPALVVLNPENLQELMQVPVEGVLIGSPALHKQLAFAVTSLGWIYCIDVNQLRLLWAHDLARVTKFEGKGVLAPVSIVSAGIDVPNILVSTWAPATQTGELLVFDFGAKLKFTKSLAGKLTSMACSDKQGRVFAGLTRPQFVGGVVQCLSAKDKYNEVWNTNAQDRDLEGQAVKIDADLKLWGDWVAAFAYDGHLHLRNVQTGAKGIKIATKLERAIKSPAIVGNICFIAGNGGIRALGPHKLDEKNQPKWSWVWTYDTPGQHWVALERAKIDDDNFLLAGAADGSVIAFPWHKGEYERFANHLAGDYATVARTENHQKSARKVAEYLSIAALQKPNRDECKKALAGLYTRWEDAGEPEIAIKLLEDNGFRDETAHLWMRIGAREFAAGKAERAREAYLRAMEIFAVSPDPNLRKHINECTEQLSKILNCANIQIQAYNVPVLNMWEPGNIELRLVNLAKYPLAGGLRLRLSGKLAETINGIFDDRLEKETYANLKIKNLMATTELSDLVIETDFPVALPGRDKPLLIRGYFRTDLNAVFRPRPPDLKLGDIGMLKIEIADASGANLQFKTGDIGLTKVATHIPSDINFSQNNQDPS